MNQLPHSLTLLAILILMVPLTTEAQDSDFALPNGPELAMTLYGSKSYQRGTLATRYRTGKVKIVSGEKSGVVAGLDQDGDGIYEYFTGLQTKSSVGINLELHHAEVLNGDHTLIINSLVNDTTLLLIVRGDETEIEMTKIPDVVARRFDYKVDGFGLHIHTGHRDFADFVD